MSAKPDTAILYPLINETQPATEDRVKDRLCADSALQETQDQGLELVTSVVAPSEVGEIAFDVIGSELAVGSAASALPMFPSVVLTHLKGAIRAI